MNWKPNFKFQVLVDNDLEFKIGLEVILSYELKAQILSYGDKVKIIAPEDLKQEHITILTKAMANYTKN